MVSLVGGYFFVTNFVTICTYLFSFAPTIIGLLPFICMNFSKNKVGYSQHNSCNGGIMYNIANILIPFCKVYLRLCPYFATHFVRLLPYFSCSDYCIFYT